MKKFIGVILLAIVILAGCSGKTEKEPEIEKTKNNIQLSEEQIDYLTSKERLTEESLSYMTKESINYHLLGTGLELYNATSGVEKNGLIYDALKDFDYTSNSDSEKEMTMEEVKNFRLLDKDMRIEKMKGYKYSVTSYKNEDGEYIFEAPIEGYKNTYMKFRFTIKDDGTIYMRVPHIYSEKDGNGFTFSILYDQGLAKSFFENNDYSYENKLVEDIQYTSVTEKSLVLTFSNFSTNTYKYNGKYIVYSIEDNGNKKEVFNGSTESYNIDGNSYTIIPVEIDRKLDKGNYVFSYGAGCEVNGDLEFSVS